MRKNFVDITYTLPEHYVYSRRRAPSVWKIFFKNARFIAGQIKKYITDFFTNRQFVRTKEYVSASYEKQWRDTNREWYKGVVTGRTPRREKNMFIDGCGLLVYSAQTQMLSHILDQLQCESVLDVGSGRGNGIIALASLRPNRTYYGIEPTKSGYERSQEWEHDIKKEAMPLVDIGENMNAIDFQRIHFFHGGGEAIPLADKSVDASYTNFVLEQIPDDYPKVLAEMRRVTRKYCLFFESFRESLSFADRLDLMNRDQFRFSFKDFERYGLRPVFFSTDFIRKTKFGSGFLIAEVQ